MEEDISIFVKSVSTYSELCRVLNRYPDSKNIKKIKMLIQKMNLDVSHFVKRGWRKGRFKTSILDVFNLRKQLRKNHRREILAFLGSKCCICKNDGTWNGQPLILHIHHINGNPIDNSKENLQILCPNCHSQTHNFGHKNIRKNFHRDVA